MRKGFSSTTPIARKEWDWDVRVSSVVQEERPALPCAELLTTNSAQANFLSNRVGTDRRTCVVCLQGRHLLAQFGHWFGDGRQWRVLPYGVAHGLGERIRGQAIPVREDQPRNSVELSYMIYKYGVRLG